MNSDLITVIALVVGAIVFALGYWAGRQKR